MPEAYSLCPLEFIPANAARGFIVETPSGSRRIFAVRRGEKIYAYLNRCPHTGITLDWMPGEFLDITGTLIQCATHGALFRIEDGLCIRGPCVNQSLQMIPVQLNHGSIVVVL